MAKKLAENGKSIVYVSHRLDEIFNICDRVTVLRDGRSQTPRDASELEVKSLVELMLGRELENMFPPKRAVSRAEPLLKVVDLWPDGALEPFNLNAFPGEILGLAGQLGSGSGYALAAMAGALKARGGAIEFGGNRFLPRSPKEAIRRGIAYCSDDRKLDGLFLGRPINENLSSPALSRISRVGILQKDAENSLARSNAEKFTVDLARLRAEAGLLSGGNQQKVALGKWMAIEPKVILVNEPTRGVDVGARAEIYAKLRELADEGAAIIFASTDIQEIAGLSDRVIAFYRGMQIDEIVGDRLEAAEILAKITHPFGSGLEKAATA